MRSDLLYAGEGALLCHNVGTCSENRILFKYVVRTVTARLKKDKDMKKGCIITVSFPFFEGRPRGLQGRLVAVFNQPAPFREIILQGFEATHHLSGDHLAPRIRRQILAGDFQRDEILIHEVE